MFQKITELEAKINELERIVKNQARIGEVVQRDMDKCRVRVKFKDADGEISYWCSCLMMKAHLDKCFWLPDIGELVFCLFLPWDLEKGFVVGAIYNEKDPRPMEGTLNTLVFKDAAGNTLLMDRATRQIVGVTDTFRVVGKLVVHGEIVAAGNVSSGANLNAQGNIYDSKGDLTNHTNDDLPRDPGGGTPSIPEETFIENYGCCGSGESAGTCAKVCSKSGGACGPSCKNESCQCGRSSCNCPGNCTCKPGCTCEHCLGGGES